MARALLAALTVLSAAAFAQTAPGGQPPATPPASEKPASDVEEVRRELENTRKELREVREEMRAQLATRSAAQGWEEEWVEEKRKLELFVPDGYFRIRPDLFNKLDLNREDDRSAYPLFPRSPTGNEFPASNRDRTNAGVNMRFRFDPTFNISEEVRLKLQIDALDNILFGSNPDYAFSRSVNGAYDRNAWTLFSDSQTPPRSGINAVQDSIMVRRVYGEVSTPVGILRFGRMGSNWGLGMLHNDGNCLDCDFGTTVDRIMFVTEPLTGYYVTPMIDFNAEGPSFQRQEGGGQPFDLSNTDDSHSFLLAVARRDTEQQARAKLENNLAVFNYGVHFTYRVQKNDPADFYGQAFRAEGAETGGELRPGYVTRGGSLYIPDVWLKYERKLWRFELEAAAVLGSINNRARGGAESELPGANQSLGITQFGGVAQGEYEFMDGDLRVQLELGYASGDTAPGLGNYPRRRVAPPEGEPNNSDNNTQPGDIDGPQYACQSTGGCTDNSIRNFRFNRDYRIDMILWREILGGITDAVYAKPTLEYRVAENFHIYASVIYSRTVFEQSALNWDGVRGDPNLGLELNAGARYVTEDGFFASVAWGILFPFAGLQRGAGLSPSTPNSLDSAQALRGLVGVRF